jgi:hypothetical protein
VESLAEQLLLAMGLALVQVAVAEAMARLLETGQAQVAVAVQEKLSTFQACL